MPYSITSCPIRTAAVFAGRNALLVVTLFAGLAPVSVFGQSPAYCEVGEIAQRRIPPRDPSLPAIAEDAIELEAGSIRMNLEETGDASMTGGVLVRYGDRAVGADAAFYRATNRLLRVDGNVRYEDAQTLIGSEAAEFDYNSGHVSFEGAEFAIPEGHSRGSAGLLMVDELGALRLDDVSYTTCPPGKNDWLLSAGKIRLNTPEGYGEARNVSLRFKGLPILYTPYLSFPIGDTRKSGILTPGVGNTSRSGTDISLPIYWNIAPNYDALLTPRLLTERGFQLNTRFRYMTPRNSGTVGFEFLPNDDLLDEDRQLFSLRHRTLLDNGWRIQVNGRDASDSRYFEDLGGSLSSASTTHLDRSIRFDYLGDTWAMLAQFQDYQTIDPTIAAENQPYQRLPQLVARGYWPDQWLGLNYRFDSELVYFQRDVGVTGWRFDSMPQAEIPWGNAGWFIKPGVALEHTRYGLSNDATLSEDRPSRTLPIASLDAGIVLERTISESRGWLHTIEPRVLYVHIPHREQSALPVFDTIQPDLNLIQLYRKNRFVGIDRIGDADQLSIGVTSRVLESRSGKELLSATIGQARYLSLRGVSLPGEQEYLETSSDYIAELDLHLYDNWNLGAGHQWSSGRSSTTQSQLRLQYRPERNKIINLEYRYRRGSLEQGDVSWSWPLAERWTFVGRYNYSLRDETTLEQFFGLEYESCCWGFRLVSRRHISARDGTADTAIAFQLVLKGMTSVGDPADRLLERGILGYSRDIE